MNRCIFTADRKYRYILEHEMNDLFSGAKLSRDYIAWIGLNPSIADEQRLDPTLTRIAGFTRSYGLRSFIMLNLFAFISTNPKDLYLVRDPVGPDNDDHIFRVTEKAAMIVCAWGAHGAYKDRGAQVSSLLCGKRAYCLGTNANGTPKHPLYLPAETELIQFPLEAPTSLAIR